MYLQLAWRNVWRNPRRTTVILIAIIIGVWSMVFLGALSRGVNEQMIRNGISTLTGEIQIHQKGYRSDPSIENSIAAPQKIRTVLPDILPSGSQWTARVRLNAIASNARHSTGISLVGINPREEAKMSFIGNAVDQGRYLQPDDTRGILIGKALADKLETKLGRKLVLMSQDTTKEIASRAFRIVGIFRAEMEATEKQYVFVNLPTAQTMLKMGQSISEFSIILPNREHVDHIAASLKTALPSHYSVSTWQQLLPLISAYLQLTDGWILIWYLVVFIAMGFGIVNTMLMAIFERFREFGLLKALGMKPWGIVKAVLTETFFLLFLGIFIGNVLGFFSISALAENGIDLSSLAEGAEYAGISRIIYPAMSLKDLATANLVVFILGIIVSVYPAIKAARFKPVDALAHT
ncbi:ABC transporter permease [Thermodesulfobacteriota bacterium]